MSWRRLRTLLRREMLATYRDPFTMTILVAVPLVALLLFGFVLSTKVKHMALGVHDASDTPASRRLVAQRFDFSDYITALENTFTEVLSQAQEAKVA